MVTRRAASYQILNKVVGNIQSKDSQKQLDKINEPYSFLNLIMLIILAIFLIGISFEVGEGMKKNFSVSQKQATQCMIDFQQKLCNPLKLQGQCQSIFNCIQMMDIKNSDLALKTWTLVSLIYDQIKQNALLPFVSIALILLYQITKSSKQKQIKREE